MHVRRSRNAYATRVLSNAGKLTGNQTAGVVVWLIGAFTTALFLKQLGIQEPICYGLGLAIQWLMTKAEMPIWRGQGTPALGIVVTAVDVAFNDAGIWPYIRDQFGNTDLWRMLSDVTHDASAPTLMVRLALTITAGIVLAGGPEYFWSRKDS